MFFTHVRSVGYVKNLINYHDFNKTHITQQLVIIGISFVSYIIVGVIIYMKWKKK